MKKILFTIITMILPLLNTSAQEYLPKWKEGFLDIHTVATGRGDAAFIIMPDGTTMLIDAGDNGKPKDKQHPNDSLRAAQWLVRYISHFSESLPNPEGIDYAMITHFHDDHYGSTKEMLPGKHGYGLSGMTLVGDKLPISTLVDRGYPEYDFPSKEKVSKEKFFSNYRSFCDYQIAKGMKMEKFSIGSIKQFKMLHNPKKWQKSFIIRNICANGEVWTGKGTNARKMYSGDTDLFDENMNACGLKISYGKFSYWNGGDLSGGNLNIYKSNERDFESQVAPMIGKVTVMKANHHGYYDTCNGTFLRTLSPDIIVIDARSNNHPVPTTMTRMADKMVWGKECDFYITVDQAREKLGEKLWSCFKPWGHIVVRVYEGGEKYQVFVLDADSLDYRIKYQSEIFSL